MYHIAGWAYPIGGVIAFDLSKARSEAAQVGGDEPSAWRRKRTAILSEIKGLEATLTRIQASGSTAVEPTQRVIADLKKRFAEIKAFLSMERNSNALQVLKVPGTISAGGT